MRGFDYLIVAGGSFIGGTMEGAFLFYAVADGDPRLIERIPVTAAVISTIASFLALALAGLALAKQWRRDVEAKKSAGERRCTGGLVPDRNIVFQSVDSSKRLEHPASNGSL